MSKKRSVHFKTAKNARELVLQALFNTDVHASYSGLTLSSLLEKSVLEPRERRQATALFYGTLSHRLGLDQCIRARSSKALADLDPLVRNSLRLAAYQIYFSPHIPARAAVNAAVDMVKQYGHQGLASYTNAVLRNLLRDIPPYPLEGAAAAAVVPELFELINAFLKDEPLCADDADIAAYWQNINRVRALSVRLHPAHQDKSQLMTELAAAGVSVKAAEWPDDALELELNGQPLTDLKAWADGRIIVQGRAAQLPALLAAEQRKSKVLDLCAAPGGKSLQLHDLADGPIDILAFELHEERLTRMRENMQRLGVTGIRMEHRDASLPLPKKELAQFDLVLADVPCSSLGLIDRKPELRFSADHCNADLLETQAAILRTAASALKSGGVLIYSTCTLNPAENQAQIKRFLIEQAGQFDLLPLVGLPVNLRKNEFTAGQLSATPGLINLYPHIHHCEAFFIAQMQRH